MAIITSLKEARVQRRLKQEGWRTDEAVDIAVSADDDAMVVFDITTAADKSGFLVALPPDDALRVLHQLEAAILAARTQERC
jgi:hypothetical protein